MTSTTYSKEEIKKLHKPILEEIRRLFPYPTPRHNQELVIFNIVKSYLEGKKYFVLEASTGFGKSVAAVVALRVITSLFSDKTDEEGNAVPFKSLVCTKTKALQKQYVKDYKDMASLWSAPGYECNKEPYDSEYYYGSHACDKSICFFFNECNFRVAKQRFVTSSEGILNYAYFMHWQKHKPDLMVLDEAHNLEKGLVDHLHVRFHPQNLNQVLTKLFDVNLCPSETVRSVSESMTEIVETSDSDVGWLSNIIDNVKLIIDHLRPVVEKIDDIKELIDAGTMTYSDDEKKVIYFNGNILTTFYNKLWRMKKSTVEWVISERLGTQSIDLKPISLAEEASFLFKRAKFSVLMSATICGIPLFCKTLGIKDEEYSYMSLDSEVPVENRRIVPVNLQGMSKSNREELLPQYLKVQDSLIEKYLPKGRGLIHSVTYENAEYIKDHSKYRKRMIIPKTEDMIEIKKLLDKHPHAILVTPAMLEGSDLSGDYCRFISFFKIPFPYLGDKWVSRKKDLDNDWYIRETINQVVQGCGRGVRSKEDYAITFILDGNFNRIRFKNDLMPTWFSNAVVK